MKMREPNKTVIARKRRLAGWVDSCRVSPSVIPAKAGIHGSPLNACGDDSLLAHLSNNVLTILRSSSIFVFIATILLSAMSAPAFAEVLGDGWHDVKGEQVTIDEANRFYANGIHTQRNTLETGQFGVNSSTTITPEIENLARALQHDPKLIYDYVHNHIEYMPYYGSMKGTVLTLLDGSGNDFDQASLMIALLRASGYSAQFVIGTQTIPGASLGNWLVVGAGSPGNTFSNRIGNVLSYAGIPYQWAGLGDGTAHVKRAWVKANIDGTDYVFDPGFKSQTSFSPALNDASFVSATN